MAGIKISSLRKELGLETKEILEILENNNIKDKKAQSSLSAEEIYVLAKNNVDIMRAIKKIDPSFIGDNTEKDNATNSADASRTKEVKNQKENDISADKKSQDEKKQTKKRVIVFRRENTKEGEKNNLKPNILISRRETSLNSGKLKPSQIASLRKEREEKNRLLKEQLEAEKNNLEKTTKTSENADDNKQLETNTSTSVDVEIIKQNINTVQINDNINNIDTPSEKDKRANKQKKKNDNNKQASYTEQHKGKRRGRKDQQIFEEDTKHRKARPNKKIKEDEEEDIVKLINIPPTLTIQELADKIKIKPSKIVKDLFLKGIIVTVNQEIEYKMAEDIAIEYDVLVEPEVVEDIVGKMLEDIEDDENTLIKRPPVVCVMGHVDHGKTSLLDAIRNTRVTDKEAGGITQHIGAYMVKCQDRLITFLDTPGHEAFTSMRQRGAKSTDVAILVVSADDGVMPQTIEAINHAKAANVEIVVAINKIDKQGANIEKVKQELSEYELIPEEWGGSTIFCPVSAKTGEGIDNLLEMVLLTSDVLELKANPNRNARGIIIEAKIDKGRGPVCTLLVQKGTLKKGDNIACGKVYGKVRAMIDDSKKKIEKASPSMPVEILGLNGVPKAGDIFICYDNEKDARNFADTFNANERVNKLSENKSKIKMSLDELYDRISEGELKELCLIVKGDVQGSVEALRQSLEKISNEEVVVKIIHRAVGNVNESDVSLASASNAIIIAFNVGIDQIASKNAKEEDVDIRQYSVIYNAIEDVEKAINGMLSPKFEEEVTGFAEVRQVFKASGIGVIAGCYITDGIVEKNSMARLYRDDNVIFDGNIVSLKRFKDDVKEVKAGFECGIVLEDYNDIKEGDNIEVYKMKEKKEV